ncbi:vitamin B12-dependent ribonucleotide reductase [Ferrimicrobium acidiphilum]|uniref:vitamin B12-dependent ribonucleotide reductase n=1 Tax=Ferrimicrobium acidiphilum TaxID=121039 RepID=UPI003C6D658F
MLTRHFTANMSSPYESISWELRHVLIQGSDGSVVFEQENVEVPDFWSLNATTILAQKYFRGVLGTPDREHSLKQVIARIVGAIATRGVMDGYLSSTGDTEIFIDELSYVLAHQIAAFNSPVWFNVGVQGVPQQASACFILSVDDTMDSILDWYKHEGIIFKGGSGAGVNLSNIRASKELLNGGGTASGPVSFMRGADASAGTIKSGGKTRRAAKMVVLDVDHPDIESFIWCKAQEEFKIRALTAAGFDMSLDGADRISVQYQNANNSVRLSDEFMEAVESDSQWDLVARTDGSVVETVSAKDLLSQIAQAAWNCGDPGVQFSTTINKWHTIPEAGAINASNPCSEFLSIDNSACNLASLNLLKFLNPDGSFDLDSFRFVAGLMFVSQDILVSLADYPLPQIKANSVKYRQLGLGFSNLGAFLMAVGLPYDSHEARSVAASITALLSGIAYENSAELARAVGTFENYEIHKDSMMRVLQLHKEALASIDASASPSTILDAAKATWESVLTLAESQGVRNSQATLLAPAGTISFLMDCDTTGIEPAFSLVSHKSLVGGGTMTIPIKAVERALHNLGYSDEEATTIYNKITDGVALADIEELLPHHLPIFSTAAGVNPISAKAHISMMGAVQPFLSGAISKTVNLSQDATVEDIREVIVDSWKLGLKAVAVYRDNCKVGQPLTTESQESLDAIDSVPVSIVEQLMSLPVEEQDAIMEQIAEARGSRVGLHSIGTVEDAPSSAALVVDIHSHNGVTYAPGSQRRRLPRHRTSRTHAFVVGDSEGYATVGEFEDGTPGELFIKISKQGSTLAGVMDAFAIAVSLGLQHGVPLETFVNKFTNMRFDPAGITDDPEIRLASSLVDYIFRRMALDYMTHDDRSDYGIHSTSERLQMVSHISTSENTGTDDTDASYLDSDTPVTFGFAGSSTSDPLVHASNGIYHTATNGSVVANDAYVQPQANVRVVDAPLCYVCGIGMVRTGACYSCEQCGSTTGC